MLENQQKQPVGLVAEILAPVPQVAFDTGAVAGPHRAHANGCGLLAAREADRGSFDLEAFAHDAAPTISAASLEADAARY